MNESEAAQQVKKLTEDPGCSKTKILFSNCSAFTSAEVETRMNIVEKKARWILTRPMKKPPKVSNDTNTTNTTEEPLKQEEEDSQDAEKAEKKTEETENVHEEL